MSLNNYHGGGARFRVLLAVSTSRARLAPMHHHARVRRGQGAGRRLARSAVATISIRPTLRDRRSYGPQLQQPPSGGATHQPHPCGRGAHRSGGPHSSPSTSCYVC